jgi:hypothetical protein
VEIKICGNKRHKDFQLFKNLIKNIYICFNNWFWALYFNQRNTTPKESVVLLDLFLLKNGFNSDTTISDRYYTGLNDYLDKTQVKKIYYLPTLFGLRYPYDWFKQFRNIVKSESNIILKEFWIGWRDYVAAIYQSLTLYKAITTIPKWKGVDISSLIREELFLERGSYSLSSSFLLYISFKKYKKEGLRITGVVDWFENQVVDRALYLGMRQFYPQVKIKGYMGIFLEGYYAGSIPMPYEYQANILPDELLVIGSKYIANKREYCQEIKVSVAPAFRFQSVINFNQEIEKNKNKVILAMPMMINESRKIIELALKATLPEKYSWVVKIHPATLRDNLLSVLPGNVKKIFLFTNKPLVDLLQEASLLVTSASSVALEAVITGVPVAIVGNRSGPTINPLYGIVDDAYWSICYTPEDLINAIKKRPPMEGLNKSIYLERATSEKVLKMLSFEK